MLSLKSNLMVIPFPNAFVNFHMCKLLKILIIFTRTLTNSQLGFACDRGTYLSLAEHLLYNLGANDLGNESSVHQWLVKAFNACHTPCPLPQPLFVFTVTVSIREIHRSLNSSADCVSFLVQIRIQWICPIDKTLTQ